MLKRRLPMLIVLITCAFSFGNEWDTNKKIKLVEMDPSSDALRVWIDNGTGPGYYYGYPTNGIYADYAKSFLAIFMTAISTGLAVDLYVPDGKTGSSGATLSSVKIHP
jgi:hypothetical protein